MTGGDRGQQITDAINADPAEAERLRAARAQVRQARAERSQRPDWCEVDECPIHVCGGPHTECPGQAHPDLIVTLRYGQKCLICERPTLAPEH